MNELPSNTNDLEAALERAASSESHNAEEMRRIALELAHRRREALRLYEPQEYQQAAHASMASERIVRKGNRAGGSIFGAAEIARAATGQDPHGKYPTNRPMMIWLIGYGLSHIGRVFHRLLFREGAFKIVKDQATQQWRAFRPWTDKELEKHAIEAPPFIPSRFIQDIAWYNKGERQFSVVRLTNGTEIRAFSSESDTPPMGDPVDLIWIDEDLAHPYWVPELQARLSDRKGRLIWTAAPLANNDAMLEMCDRAEEQMQARLVNPDFKPDIELFQGTFSGNPYIDADEKRKRLAGWDADTRIARDRGEFLTDSRQMYPSFNVKVHGIDEDQYREWGECRDWCRYMIVDPGHSVCAVLFGAVAPPRLGKIWLCEDCLYLRNCNAEMFAAAVKKKVEGKSFRSFIIDKHGSAFSDAGTGKSIYRQYMEALRKAGVKSEVTGSGFDLTDGGDGFIQSCAMAVRTALAPQEDGLPLLRVRTSTMSPLIQELPRYRKKMDHKHQIILDSPDPRSRLKSHLTATLDYFVSKNPRYHSPKKTAGRSTLAKDRLKFKQKLQRAAYAKGALPAR